MIRAVLFDLDGTLFDRDSSVRRLAAAQYDACAALLGPIAKDAFVERLMALDARGYVPKQQVYRTLVRELGITDATADVLFAYFEAHYHDRCLLFPEAIEVLDELVSQRLALGIITNGGFPWQLRTVQACGIERYFAAILVSGAEGIRKPEPAIFWRAVQRLAVSPSEAVFVGDHPSVDIAGARNAGLRAIWKRDPYWDAPSAADGGVDDLSRLPQLIGELGTA